jgi:hypothetical protein
VNQVDEWRRVRADATRHQFEAMHPYAFLVSAPRGRGTGDFSPLSKQIEFRTVTHDKGVSSKGVSSVTPSPATISVAPYGSDERVVLALIKAATNPFPERISIGRAPNCDLVIRDPSVSKLHGHFREIRRDSAVFTDAKSSNGTRIDGTNVEPGEPVEIGRQSLVVLGRVRLMLLSPADVYDWL